MNSTARLRIGPRISYQRAPVVRHDTRTLAAVLHAVRWPGVCLPAARVLGSVVIPVVSFTGAR
ncbi:MAG: hypothetical protein LCH77_01105 [Actinobacteria bacterium]|nr:hypothetical protein [Actinomycetota bacterium]